MITELPGIAVENKGPAGEGNRRGVTLSRPPKAANNQGFNSSSKVWLHRRNPSYCSPRCVMRLWLRSQSNGTVQMAPPIMPHGSVDTGVIERTTETGCPTHRYGVQTPFITPGGGNLESVL